MDAHTDMPPSRFDYHWRDMKQTERQAAAGPTFSDTRWMP